MNRTMTTALAALAVLGAGATARAQSSGGAVGVRDGAGMFSAGAVKEANEALRDVRRKTHWSALIETVESLDGKPVRDAAVANAKALKEHGLYLLISRHDHQFYAEPSHSAEKAFTHETINAIKSTLTSDFKAKKYDEGLLGAVAQIRRAAESTPDTSSGAPAPVREARSEGLPGDRDREPAPAPVVPARKVETGSVLPMLLLGGGAVIVVLWLLSRAFRSNAPAYPPSSLAQDANPGYRPVQPGPGPGGPGYGAAPGPRPAAGYGPQQPPPPGYGPPPGPGYGAPGYGGPGYAGPPQQAGGGGFLSGVLGGAAGAMAGNILYDKFGRPHEGPGVPPHVPGNVPPHEASAFPPGHANPDPVVVPPSETYDPNAGGGGDWGTPEPPPEPDAAAGGDWGAPEPDNNAGGGDWSAPEPDNNAGGGDWGAPEPDNNAGGGDWGADNPAPDEDQGGSW